MFGDILRNVWRHSPECLSTFPGMFEDIPRNFCRHSPECFRTFLRMFGDIPQNVWGHSPECNIPPILRVPRIPFPVPVFLVLHIALLTADNVMHKFDIIYNPELCLNSDTSSSDDKLNKPGYNMSCTDHPYGN